MLLRRGAGGLLLDAAVVGGVQSVKGCGSHDGTHSSHEG